MDSAVQTGFGQNRIGEVTFQYLWGNADLYQASNAVKQAENLLQQAENRLKEVKEASSLVHSQEQEAQKLSGRLLTEAGAQIERHWQQMLDATRLETRGTIDRSLADFKTLLRETEGEGPAAWERNERQIFEEVAQKLQKTFKWQDAVVKWLEKEKKNPVVTLS